jgi:death-on-curing protein
MMKPRFLDLAEVLEIHQSRIELYGGSPGLRDFGLLQSALAQPSAGIGGEFLHADLYDMAAAYLFHLSSNHPFVDGNKRTALACCLVFLSYNSIEIDADPDDLERLVVDTASGQKDKAQIANVLRDNGK